jgi:hypothetical protein
MTLQRSSSSQFRRTLRLEGLEDRTTPSTTPMYSAGAGAGFLPLVNVYLSNGGGVHQFNAYNPVFRGGVRVATADINGDGVNDIITAPGPGGGPDIRVFDGATGLIIREFLAYDASFFGGVFVAAGDINGDGRADIITGAGAGGGPHVKAFSGANGQLLTQFFAYDAAFRIFNPLTAQFTANFFAFNPATRFGVNVASMATGVFGSNDIITSLGFGGPPEVRVFSNHFALLADFFAADPNSRGGVNVGSVLSNFGVNTILTGAGIGSPQRVNVYVLGFTANLQSSVIAFDPASLGGIYVG